MPSNEGSVVPRHPATPICGRGLVRCRAGSRGWASQVRPTGVPSEYSEPHCLSPLVKSSESSGGRQTITTQCEQDDRDWRARGSERGVVEEVMCS